MKNNLTDSIYKAWRTGILPLVTALLLLTGCEMDSDMNLPLNVDSNKYTLTSDAGSTQVRIYSTGEWSVRLSEDVEWASINRLNGSGNTPYCSNTAPTTACRAPWTSSSPAADSNRRYA